MTRLTLFALAFTSLPALIAQTTPLSLSTALTVTPQGFGITGSGTGTLTPGGAVTVSLTGVGSGDDRCSDVLELNLAIAVANGDRLNMTVSGPAPTPTAATVTVNYLITGGTGQFQGRGGTGTGSLAATQTATGFSVVLSLAGNLAPTFTPVASIKPSGVVPVGSTRAYIMPGSWVSIYGNYLANSTAQWNGDYPTSLGGVTATINGKAAFFWFVSPGQINLQAPDETAAGCVDVTLNTPNGTTSIRTELAPSAPSFSMLDSRYPAAIILTPGGGGSQGGGTYDIAGPVGRFPYATRPVRKGETLVLYGVGFGPTNPPVPAGRAYNGPPAPMAANSPVSVRIGNVDVPATFVGMISNGLYQINLPIPQNLPSGDQPIRILTRNAQTGDNIFISIF